MAGRLPRAKLFEELVLVDSDRRHLGLAIDMTRRRTSWIATLSSIFVGEPKHKYSTFGGA